MLLLHLSDLHFGNKNRFSGDNPADLGRAFYHALEAARKNRDLPQTETIAIVIITGDIAESGLPSEFKAAREFLVAMAGAMKLLHDRFVFLPGNHDISWAACKKVRAACADEEFSASELEDRLHKEKLANYRDFLANFYGAAVDVDMLAGLPNSRALKGGGCLRDFPDLRFSIAALNTTEREHDEEKGGFLSPEQAQALMTLWKDGDTDSYIKILAIHHNPIATTATNRDWTIEWLRAKERKAGVVQPMSADVFEHYRADLAGFNGSEHLPNIVKDVHPQLIIHGHHHDHNNPMSWYWDKDGSAPILSVGSLGLRENQLPNGVPLSCQFLHFILPPDSTSSRLHAIPLVYDGRFRLNGQVMAGAFRPEEQSRASYNQPLSLPHEWEAIDSSAGAPLIVAHSERTRGDPVPVAPALYAEPGYIGAHHFVGRRAQLDTLSDWAAPADGHPVLLFEAIGGTGKSMLTWEWTTKYAAKVRTDWAGSFWYSFYEKGATMADFCRRALAYMASHTRDRFREKNTAELTEPIIHQLRNRPWLLILDGLERVLVAYHRFDAAQLRDEEAGSADRIAQRDPCAAINPEDDDLLRAMAGASPSKLLLTSRLIPRVLLNQSSQPIPGVLRERLPGLRPGDAESLIRACGVTGASNDIQSYLKTHCDCHPLVIGVLAGLICDYLPDRGNFDAWAVDPVGGGQLNLADLNLVQKRNHILTVALAALSDKSRQLLSTLALLSEAVDYPTLCALNPHLPILPEEVETPLHPASSPTWHHMTDAEKASERERYKEASECRKAYERALKQYESDLSSVSRDLTDTVKDLERRGLLQYDPVAKRHDLHPVVRGISAGGLKQEEKDQYGQRVVDHFSQQAQNPYEKAETLEDFANARRIVKALFQMGKLEQARDFILQNTFIQALSSKFEAHNEILTIIRPFFSNGWNEIPASLGQKGGSSLARRASVALRRIGALQDAFCVSEAALKMILDANPESIPASHLLNLASTLGDQNRLALEERLMLLAESLISVYQSRYDLLSFRLARFRQFTRSGLWSDARQMWSALNALNLGPGEQSIAAHHYVLFLFFQGQLTDQELSKAEELNRSVSALGSRNLFALRGFWRLEQRNWTSAKKNLQQAITLAHKAGKVDRRSEIRFALAKFHLEQLQDPIETAEQFSRDLEPSCQRALGDLWLALGQHERARPHAIAGYKWAWADGAPYVHQYELEKALSLLRELNTEIPSVSADDPTNTKTLSWEGDVVAAIEALRARKVAKEENDAQMQADRVTLFQATKRLLE